MEVNEQTIFRELSQQDFGLDEKDSDAHVPQFFMVSKVPKEQSRSQSAKLEGVPLDQRPIVTRGFHTQSAEGKARQRERKYQKRREERRATASERVHDRGKGKGQGKAKGNSGRK